MRCVVCIDRKRVEGAITSLTIILFQFILFEMDEYSVHIEFKFITRF